MPGRWLVIIFSAFSLFTGVVVFGLASSSDLPPAALVLIVVAMGLFASAITWGSARLTKLTLSDSEVVLRGHMIIPLEQIEAMEVISGDELKRILKLIDRNISKTAYLALAANLNLGVGVAAFDLYQRAIGRAVNPWDKQALMIVAPQARRPLILFASKNPALLKEKIAKAQVTLKARQ